MPGRADIHGATAPISTARFTRQQWDELVPLFRDLSYCQCGSYAEMAAKDASAVSEFIGVFQSKELVGLANVRKKKLRFTSLGIAYVHYGPLTARRDEFSAEPFSSCLDALRLEYVERQRLLLRIIPPLCGGQWQEDQNACFEMHGFRPYAGHKSRETLILDLVNPLTDIRKRLDRKWRNHLSKAQRSNIKVTKSVAPADFERFESLFCELVNRKGFNARQDAAFFKRVHNNAHATQKMVAHLAWHDGELIAGHIGSFVGETAVYLLGAANPKGREIRASYLLQWAAIEYAKSVGNLFYDLGGIDQKANPDVYSFKSGLNGRRVTEMGPYERAPTRLSSHVLHFLEEAYDTVRAIA